jgi:hypothetical protein
VDKVTFLVNEYAPPYKQLIVNNTFLWVEDKRPFIFSDTDSATLDLSLVDISYETTEDWFNSNGSNTPAGESYYRDTFVSEIYFQDSITLSEIESFITAYDEMSEDLSIGLSDDEINSKIVIDNESSLGPDPVILNPVSDYNYESAEWFGSNVGLTNMTATYLGETYLMDILDEYDEVITVA